MSHQMNNIQIHCKSLNEGFFFYATDNLKKNLTPSDWANHFLLWDTKSFYGNFYTIETIDDVQGIRLSSSDWIRITSEEPFNSFVEWRWDDLSALCLSLGDALNETIQNTKITPNVMTFDSENLFYLPNEFNEEFHESFGRK